MASSKEYLDFILEQLSELEDVSYRAMMGEYIIYYDSKVVGGIYDDRFLVKPTISAVEKMPDASLELLYEGAADRACADTPGYCRNTRRLQFRSDSLSKEL